MGRTRKTCGGLLHFENIRGLLVHKDGVYSSRCPSCGRTAEHKKMPSPGAKCRALSAASA